MMRPEVGKVKVVHPNIELYEKGNTRTPGYDQIFNPLPYIDHLSLALQGASI